MAVAVRRATKQDARTVAEFAIKLFAQHRKYNSRRFAEVASLEGAERFYSSQSEAKDAAVLVAELENKIVGFAYLQFEALDYANLLENAAWLHDIYVDEKARGFNAGKILIAEAVKTAKSLGADKLMLMAASQNEYAKQFFERQGFETTMVEMMLDLTVEKDND